MKRRRITVRWNGEVRAAEVHTYGLAVQPKIGDKGPSVLISGYWLTREVEGGRLLTLMGRAPSTGPTIPLE
jgi:hypothetical protein